MGPIYSTLDLYFYFPVDVLIGSRSFLKMVISSEIIIFIIFILVLVYH